MTTLFYSLIFFWLVQQVNDIVNAFLNRRNVPKLYWVSAAASFVSGALLFVFLGRLHDDIQIIAVALLNALSQ